MNRGKVIPAVLAVLFTALSSMPCIGGEMATEYMKLGGSRIYFGHQSVGYNILQGINDVLKEAGRTDINVIEITDPSRVADPGIYHAKVGTNGDPKSKIDSFSRMMYQGVGGRVSIAFFKFCYVDFGPDTDVEETFIAYCDAIGGLEKAFPNVVFVHFTAPMTVQARGLKSTAKRLLHRYVQGYDDNIKINQYNDLVRREYSGKAPLFDLAEIESTTPEGKRVTFAVGSKTYYTLYPGYSDDGAHLNEQGRRLAAGLLLTFLANLAK